jgi:hypothetical protein
MTRRLRHLAVGSAVLLGIGASATLAVPGASADTIPVTVTVNTRAGLARVPTTGLGVNHAVWDGQLGTTEVSDLLKSAGVQMIRYPGGSYGDIYHWKDNTAPGGYVAPGTDFDTFMAGVQRVGAKPIIIANYGTGTAQEAADWVEYANVTKGYGVKYWEIGNELYGNGHYGSGWEADDHDDKSPTGYARGVVEFSDAMKAVDPSIKIGAVLTTPGNWPDGIVADGDTGTWNKTVLSEAGDKIDFVILHWYPGNNGVADVLAKPNQITDMIYLVRRQIAAYAGANASNIGISLTETSSGVATNTQPGALYAADAYTTLWENGVFTVDWWNVHNGVGTVTTVAGQTDYGDFGLLSSAGCSDTGECEPALNTPFAPYYAIQLLSKFARPGDQLIRAGTDQPLVSAHAIRRPDGDLTVLLVNKDPDNSRQANITYAGYTPAESTPVVHSFTTGATSIKRSRIGTATSQTLPPYSLTTITLHPASNTSGAPDAPGQPQASAITDDAATITWPAAHRIHRPIASYEIYRQDGALSVEMGETRGRQLTVSGLEPGTRYTVNVLARDVAGAVSWSSPPLTFTTGTPAESTCAVRFTDTSDWGNGFVGSIDITNNGAEPIDGWTLSFTWPTAWQSLSSGWSGNWTTSGSTVTVTNADYNQTITANGGTANTGFVGSYSGPNVYPTVFTLNGTICTTTS